MESAPGLTSDMQRYGGIKDDVSITAIARQLFLPTASSINLDLSAVLTVLTVLALLTIIVLRLNQTSDRSIGQARQFVGLCQRKKKPVTIAEEELGLEGKLGILSHSQRQAAHPPPSTSPLASAFIKERSHYCHSLPEAPNFNTMANSPSPPSVLRPTARPPTPHSGTSATITLAQGRYTGVLLPVSSTTPREVEAWRGIPYAQSTGGTNRFRPPVPLPSNDAAGLEVKNASEFGCICPGSIARVNGINEGEDCLNLNVYRQRQRDDSEGAKMPVLVYVHGGAFNGGMGVERDMASFVGWADTPIVGINFNYRVGALGFPSSAVADGEGCLNLGLKDQRLLFEWVRENVGAFGGDKNRVTVMGLSAGAHSVSLLLFGIICLSLWKIGEAALRWCLARLSWWMARLCWTGKAEVIHVDEAGITG